MNGETFSIGEAISVGWKSVTGSLGFWIAVTAIFIAVGVAPDLLADRMGEAAGLLVFIVGVVLYVLVMVGFVDLSLKAVDDRPLAIGNLFSRADRLVPYLLASILWVLGVAVGTVLLVIPGIIVFVMWYFYDWEVVGEGAGPVEALGRSFALTKGHRVQVFLFVLALVGVNLLGLLALLVGILVTIPLSMIASAHVYRRLQAFERVGSAEPTTPGGF